MFGIELFQLIARTRIRRPPKDSDRDVTECALCAAKESV